MSAVAYLRATFFHAATQENVGVVIEPRDQQLVAALQVASDGPLKAKVNVVILAPKTTSSGSQLKKSAMAACAGVNLSVRSLVGNAPCVLVFEVAEVMGNGVDYP